MPRRDRCGFVAFQSRKITSATGARSNTIPRSWYTRAKTSRLFSGTLSLAVLLDRGARLVDRSMMLTIEYTADAPSESASTIRISARMRPRAPRAAAGLGDSAGSISPMLRGSFRRFEPGSALENCVLCEDTNFCARFCRANDVFPTMVTGLQGFRLLFLSAHAARTGRLRRSRRPDLGIDRRTSHFAQEEK